MYWIPELGAARLAISPGPQGGDLLEDEIRSLRAKAVDVLVSALTSEQIEEFDLVKEPEYCRENGIDFRSFPIPDHDVPNSYEDVRVLAEQLSKDVLDGKTVVIHCLAGIGRSALLAACTLCVMGISPSRAFVLISRARGWNVPETELQRAWVERFAEKMQVAKLVE